MADHDWEALYAQLEQATGAWTREELVGLLRDLVREYVIERGLPTGTPAEAATPDLASFDFPGLIQWLKRTLTLAELDLFSVDGRRVIVDADGPRELSLDRATETAPRPRAPRRPPSRTVPLATAPARPAATPEDSTEEDPKPRRGLGRGFRGLEFD